MKRYLAALVAALFLFNSPLDAQVGGGVNGDVPPGSSNNPPINLNFATGIYHQVGAPTCRSAATCLTVTRASTSTDLLPSSASGYVYTTYANNTPRISAAAGGLIVEGGSTNELLNSAAPVTQTTASLGTGTTRTKQFR